jgi:DNA invertase Pin-like site-specific DNA recombinase
LAKENAVPPPNPPLAYSYIRFSSPEQAKGDSLRRQTEKAAEWCERNNVTLDTSTTLHDLGKSAYTGRHRQNPDRHALAAFLKMIEAGKIPHGSHLLIENLDRLSREDEVPACHLLTGILMAGVRVVQLSPYEMLLTEKSNGWELMRAVMELSRGHGESARKAELVGSAWAEKKRRARAGLEQPPRRKDGRITRSLTDRRPAWVEERGGKLVAIAERAATIKRIFALAAAGYGTAGIVKKLTEEKVPPFGSSGRWARTYVWIILRDRRVLGELQPRRSNGQPDGDPIKDYFPQIVTEAEWGAARGGAIRRPRHTSRGRRWTPAEDKVVLTLPRKEAAEALGRSWASVNCRRSELQNRRRKAKGKKKQEARTNAINVFSGLLKDPHDGGSYYVATRSSARYGRSWRVLLNLNSAQGRGPARSFPFDTFERAVLSLLREIDPHEILNGDHGPDEALLLAGELAGVEARIAELEAELLKGDVAALARVLRQLEERKRDLDGRLAAAREKAAHPLSAAWGEAQSLAATLDSAPDPNDVRLRLRSAIRRMIESIWLLPVAHGRDRLCAVQVWFAGGKRHRDYLILHRPPKADGKRPAKPGGWWARSMAVLAKPDDLDLRKPAHAKRLEAALAKVDLDGHGEVD